MEVMRFISSDGFARLLHDRSAFARTLHTRDDGCDKIRYLSGNRYTTAKRQTNSSYNDARGIGDKRDDLGIQEQRCADTVRVTFVQLLACLKLFPFVFLSFAFSSSFLYLGCD